MRLHLLAIPHTVTCGCFSHCAYTAKVLKFPAMMLPLGYDIIHYGVGGADFGFHWKRTCSDGNPGSLELVDIMTGAEQNALRGHDGSDPTRYYGDDANVGTPLYKEFNRRLRLALIERVTQADLVLLPFGHAHGDALSDLPFKMVESGIGYATLYAPAQFKIFESYAWMHFHQGREDRYGRNYEWAIPNYFNVDDWDLQLAPDMNTVVFLGRICDVKGLPTVVEIAKRRPDLRFIICGQGDPAPYLTQPNIEYRAPITGKARSAYLGNARAVLMPTVFTEPFAGVAVEAQMCGTPVISTSYGAFTETIEDEVTGFRAHTLGDFLAALDRAPDLDRAYIADRARRLYGYERVGKMYDRAFQQIQDLQGEGWYSPRSVFQRGTSHDMDSITPGNSDGSQQGISRTRRALPPANIGGE
jgi:glycosyltransferase involved in cell wall biosynthesis